MKFSVIKTNSGYMVEDELNDYVCDIDGNNLFDTYVEAQTLMHTHLLKLGTNAEKCNALKGKQK
jgi:hypothetical protein